jgi:hypothetical protein
MRKRIGTRIYDTETADLIHEAGGVRVYRKQTRGRECFMTDGSELFPLTAEESAVFCEPAEAKTYFVRLDHDSHARLTQIAKSEHCTMSEAVKKLILKKSGA